MLLSEDRRVPVLPDIPAAAEEHEGGGGHRRKRGWRKVRVEQPHIRVRGLSPANLSPELTSNSAAENDCFIEIVLKLQHTIRFY